LSRQAALGPRVICKGDEDTDNADIEEGDGNGGSGSPGH
jgi:hypothetical protein